MNFDQLERKYISLIESNLNHFNTARRKRLSVQYYVDLGNRARVLWGHVTVADFLTIQECHAFVWGFSSGRERR